jgi:hypothetical protein
VLVTLQSSLPACLKTPDLQAGSRITSHDTRLNFGLGDATNVDLVRIEWPSGVVQELTNVAVDQILTLWEPPA